MKHGFSLDIYYGNIGKGYKQNITPVILTVKMVLSVGAHSTNLQLSEVFAAVITSRKRQTP